MQTLLVRMTMERGLSNAEHSLRSRLHSVVDEVLRRRSAGEPLSDESVIAQHPDLAELLAEELARLRVIVAAVGKAKENHNGDTSNRTEDYTPRRTPGRLVIRCPHCREPFEADSDTPATEIVCESCGSHFSLTDGGDETRASAALKSLGHFDLVERIGVGGFGTVWKGRDRELDRTVAVKIPRQGIMDEKELEKFLREARAAAQLKHPNIVSVHEVGRDGDTVFIVSDYVRGISLDDWLTGQQPTMRQAAEMCATIAEALQHAHEQGVIHRDLKPANIMIDGDGQPHLMDFGLARRDVGEVTMTMDGQVLGTPAYMSPEQAMGEAHTADRRTDVYSLGVILFELLTGERPFRGNARMLVHQVIHDPPPSPRKFNPNVPRDLETITLKCLEKEPNRRYQSAGEVADELRRFLARKPIRARSVGPIERSWRWAKRRPSAAALLALLLLVTVVGPLAAVQQAALRREREIALAALDKQTAELQSQLVRNLIEHGAADYEAGKNPEAIALVAAAYARARPDDPMRESARNLLAGWSATGGVPLVHDSTVGAVAFSPDGQFLVTGSADGTVRQWDAKSGMPAGIPAIHGGFVAAFAFSPDGQAVISCGQDGVAHVWNLDTGRYITKPLRHGASIVAAAYRPDSSMILTVGIHQTARQWDAATGKSLIEPLALRYDDRVTVVAIRPDGQAFATGGRSGIARIWDATTGEPLGELIRHGERVSSITFSPDGGSLLTGSWDHTAVVWDLKTRKPIGAAKRHAASVDAVAFSRDGRKVATGSWDGTARVWDAATGVPLGPPLLHDRGVKAVAFGPDGHTLLTGSYDRTARVWNADTGIPSNLSLTDATFPARDFTSVKNAVFSPDGGTLLATNGDNTARFLHVSTGEVLGSPLDHDNRVTSLAFHPAGTVALTGCADGFVRFWDALTQRSLSMTLRHSEAVRATAFSPDGKTILTGCDDGSARLWNAVDGSPIGQPWQHGFDVVDVDFCPDGHTAFTLTGSEDGVVRQWDVTTGERLTKTLRQERPIAAVACSPDGRLLLTGGFDNTARLWDAKSFRPLAEPLRHDSWIYSVAFSPDGRRAATGSRDGSTRLWDVATGKLLGEPLRLGDFVVGVAISPSGKEVLAISAAHAARLWRLPQLPEDSGAIRNWAKARSGLEVDAKGLFRHLNQREWLAALGIEDTRGQSQTTASFLEPPISQLRQKIGQQSTVEFDVASTGSDASGQKYLNSLANYRDRDCFIVAIDPSTNLLHPPLAELDGRRVRVTGELCEFEGRVQISVRNIANQMQICTDDEKWISIAAAPGSREAAPFAEFLEPSVEQLRSRIGRQEQVEFRVQLVGGDQHCYLNSLPNYMSPKCFTAVVLPDQVSALETLGLKNPVTELRGKVVRVIGTVEEHDGRIEIRITDVARQLQIVESSESSVRR